MEILSSYLIKTKANEEVSELIQIIKSGKELKFLEGPLWMDKPPRTYRNRLTSRQYRLIGNHIYRLKSVNGTRVHKIYLSVSDHGKIKEITYDEAFKIVCERKGYVEDSDLQKLEPNDDPSIPACDAGTCDW